MFWGSSCDPCAEIKKENLVSHNISRKLWLHIAFFPSNFFLVHFRFSEGSRHTCDWLKTGNTFFCFSSFLIVKYQSNRKWHFISKNREGSLSVPIAMLQWTANISIDFQKRSKNIIAVTYSHKKTIFNMIQFLLLAAVANFILPAEGHVALTFPPARKYDLDFLDTLRSVRTVFSEA